MTEQEAKTKWCPFARLGSTTTGLGGFNRFIEPVGAGSEDKVCCIGSACMAWRKFSMDDQTRGDSSKRGGWCGLAGKA